MAMNNDVIDLSAAAAAVDVFLASATLNATGTLVLSMNDGVVHLVDLTAMAANLERGGLNWNPATAYKAGDVVSSGIDLYVAIVDNMGFIPTANPAQWTIVTGVAEQGGLAWNNATVYNPGDIVSYNGMLYISKTTHAGSTPDLSPLDWIVGSTIEHGGIAWLATTAYNIGDSVTVAGTMYVANVPNTGSMPTLLNPDWSDAFIVSNVDPGAF